MGSGIEVCLLCPGPTFSDLLEVAATENPGEKFGESMRSTDKVELRNPWNFSFYINILFREWHQKGVLNCPWLPLWTNCQSPGFASGYNHEGKL